MLADLRYITGGGRPYWGFVGLVASSAVVQAATVLTLFPLLRTLFGESPAAAWPWLLGFLALIVVAWGIDIAAARRGLDLGIAVLGAIHRHTPRAVTSWPDTWLTPEKTGKLRKLVSDGANEATSSVILMIGPVITSFVFTFALGIGLVRIDGVVAAVTIAGGFLLLGALRAGMRLETRAEDEFTRANEELDSRLFEYAWAQPSLRTARRTSAGRKLVDDAIAGARGRTLKVLLWQVPSDVLFNSVLQFVLIAFGAATWMAFDRGSLDAVGAAAMVVVLLRVVEQVTVVSGSVAGILGISRTLAETREVMETSPIVHSCPSSRAPRMTAERLGVTYPDGTVGLSSAGFELKPGSVTVVIGRSGSGKTTLLQALAGLTAPTEGGVLLDGSAAGPGDLRGKAAVVFQQTALAAGTVRDSIVAVNQNLSEAELERIAELSQLRRALEKLPDGWDTPVGELGQRLSGGERQRVGIARALAKPTRLLLIDEATSALDSRNERAVIDAIARVGGRYTTVIVTHRPATLQIADRVIVMDDGRIAEAGTPAQLEAAGGEFARLVNEWRESEAWRVG